MPRDSRQSCPCSCNPFKRLRLEKKNETDSLELHAENGRVEPALVVVQSVRARVLQRKPILHLRVAHHTQKQGTLQLIKFTAGVFEIS